MKHLEPLCNAVATANARQHQMDKIVYAILDSLDRIASIVSATVPSLLLRNSRQQFEVIINIPFFFFFFHFRLERMRTEPMQKWWHLR